MKAFFKWSSIGCGGLLVLIVLLVILFFIAGGRIVSPTDEDQDHNAASGSIGGGTRSTQIPSRSTGSAPVAKSAPTLPAEPVPSRHLTPTPLPTATPKPTPIVLGIDELLNEYTNNKVRANARLRYQENGKFPVSTSGYISKVEELYVGVSPEQSNWDVSSYQGINCYYSNVEAALRIDKGQFVIITGKVSGEDKYPEYDRIAMFDCEIEGLSLPKPPAIPSWVVRENTVQVFCISPLFIVSRSYRGTGVILDPQEGTILTVYHVISDDSHDKICESIEVEVPGLVLRIPASVSKHCASIDRAHLSVSPEALAALDIQPLHLATAPAQIDQEVYFWGFGTGQLRLETGLVERIREEKTLVDAYGVPGDSGSPVFNEYGHWLGTMSQGNTSDIAVFTGSRC